MRKLKLITLFIVLTGCNNILFAQSIDEGKRQFYYERYNSALNTFTNLVNANSNNVEAVYWLGQTMIANENIEGAKALYQKTLMQNPNAALVLVGMGHVELLQNKTTDARSRFETAISLSRGKDASILNAIGRANVDAKAGDAAYAVEKLRIASDLNKKSAEILINLGDAYRKMTDGANAIASYQRAAALEPDNAQTVARANFMAGRIYQTQGRGQENIYMNNYQTALTKDPNYGPVYYWLYDYYYRRDVNKSREYLDKYIAVSDPDNKTCYYQASILYASSMFQQSIAKANECISKDPSNVYPNLYGLQAYSYDKLGDSVKAKQLFDTYFQKQNPEKLAGGDYATYAKVLLKFPGNEVAAANLLDKAVAVDTVEANKVMYLNDLAESLVAAKNYQLAGTVYAKILAVKRETGKLDLYNAGFNSYRGGNYKSADSVFAVYMQKYPDDVIGYYYRARANAEIDSTGKLSLAKPYYEKVIQLGEASADAAAAKPTLLTAYRYMVAYYYNKNDRETALAYTNKILAIEPNDQQALTNRTLLMAPAPKASVKSKTPTKPVTKAKVKIKGK
ncbi:tetratricopeptide repeat protein [soil metagenome]